MEIGNAHNDAVNGVIKEDIIGQAVGTAVSAGMIKLEEEAFSLQSY